MRVALPPPEERRVLPGLVRGVGGREHRAARGSHRHYGGRAGRFGVEEIEPAGGSRPPLTVAVEGSDD